MLDTGIDHRNQSQDVLGKDQHMGVTGIKLKGAFNRPLAATSSRDVIFIKLWATTLRMPEMEKAYRKYHNGQV